MNVLQKWVFQESIGNCYSHLQSMKTIAQNFHFLIKLRCKALVCSQRVQKFTGIFKKNKQMLCIVLIRYNLLDIDVSSKDLLTCKNKNNNDNTGCPNKSDADLNWHNSGNI